MKKLVSFFGTLFYIGYIPVMPGTFGTLFAFVFCWFVLKNDYLTVSLFLIFSLLSIFICNLSEKEFGKKDDSRIVLDEFVGSFFSLIFLPKNLLIYILAFVLFRVFDITKPLFIKKSQNLRGGVGIVVDDVLAGVAANVILQVFNFIIRKG